MVFAMAYSLQITMWIVTLSSPSNDPNLDITQTTISHFLNTALSTTTEIVWPIHCKYVISTSSYKIGKMFKKFISPFPIFSFSFFPILSCILFFTCCYKFFFFFFLFCSPLSTCYCSCYFVHSDSKFFLSIFIVCCVFDLCLCSIKGCQDDCGWRGQQSREPITRNRWRQHFQGRESEIG